MIFVTGGTGLVGSHLLFELIQTGSEVKAMKRESSDLQQVHKVFSYYSKDADTFFRKIKWVEGDLLDYFNIEKIIGDADEVYHCAAIVSFDSSERGKMIRNNVEGTSNLVNACLEKKVNKFCHVSSIAALGKTENGNPVNEETKWIPSRKHSGYSESKFFSEVEVWRGIEEGLNAVIVNPTIILGPGNWGRGSSRFFSTIHKGLNYYTRGITGYVSVQDVIKAMVLLMDDKNFEKCKNQRFLLNAEDLSYQEFFNLIADALGKQHPKYYASDFILRLAWRILSAISLVTRIKPTITRETVLSANEKHFYDGSKMKEFVGLQYTGISEIIEKTAKLFTADLNKNTG